MEMMDEWISTEDRMPKDSEVEEELILCQGPNSKPFIGLWLYDAFHDYSGKRELTSVKYWRTLPMPPKNKIK